MENEVSNRIKSVVLHQLFAFHAIFSMDIQEWLRYFHGTGNHGIIKQLKKYFVKIILKKHLGKMKKKKKE